MARAEPGARRPVGGQGAGKSTLAALLETACRAEGLRTAVLALDDFYWSREERQRLAAQVHPLLETRGPPGTHDVARCLAAMEALGGPGPVSVPIFDKGLDDRVGERHLMGPVDLVVLEGWCVGASSVEKSALSAPCNALERSKDPSGRWRGYVNDQLRGDYAALWAALDTLVFLKVPSLDAVRRWRSAQEAERPAEQRMSPAEVEAFVAHYERVTSSMLETLPGVADWCVELGEDHAVVQVTSRKSRQGSANRPGGAPS